MFLNAGRVSAAILHGSKQTAQQSSHTVEGLLNKPPKLVGNGVVLRATEKEDVKALSKILCSYDENEIKLLFEPSSKKFKNEKEAEAFVNGRLADKNDLVYTIMSDNKKGEQKVVGLLSILFQRANVVGVDLGHTAQFFMFIDKNSANKKLGTAVTEPIMDLICKIQKVGLFIAPAWVENEVSVKIVKNSVKKLKAKLKDAFDQSVSVSVPYTTEKVEKKHKKNYNENHKIYVGLVVCDKMLNSAIDLLKKDKKAYDDVVEKIVKGFVSGKMSDKDFWSKILKQVDLRKFFSLALGSFFGIKKVNK